jgi:threonyl-tRNA synthetase
MQNFIILPVSNKFFDYATNNVYNHLVAGGLNVQVDINFDNSLNKRICDAKSNNINIIIVGADECETNILCFRPPNNGTPLKLTIDQIIHKFKIDHFY